MIWPFCHRCPRSNTNLLRAEFLSLLAPSSAHNMGHYHNTTCNGHQDSCT